jgi:hypothetical protein
MTIAGKIPIHGCRRHILENHYQIIGIERRDRLKPRKT